MPNEVKAQNTIDLTSLKELSDTVVSTDQYFWHTTNDTGFGAGTHITQKPKEEVLQDPTNAGGNLLATSTGLTLRNGTDMLAEFTREGITVDLQNAAGISRSPGILFLQEDCEGMLDVRSQAIYTSILGDGQMEVGLSAGSNPSGAFPHTTDSVSRMYLRANGLNTSYCRFDFLAEQGSKIAGLEFGYNKRMHFSVPSYANGVAQIEVSANNGADIALGIGSGGVNYGVYSYTDGEWIIYKNANGDTRTGTNGEVNLQTGYDCRNSINACGKMSIQVKSINVGTISANSSKNASVSAVAPAGYIGRAIVGFDLQGTGTAGCSLVKLYFNQTDEEVVYWIRNFNNSATGTVTLRAFILCTYDD